MQNKIKKLMKYDFISFFILITMRLCGENLTIVLKKTKKGNYKNRVLYSENRQKIKVEKKHIK